MKANAPRFALVVPTRDRPAFLAFCLASLARQTFADFQVIVSDNALRHPADAAFAPFRDDPRFRLVRPPRPLSMPDHWDFALSHAAAPHVGVVIDKTVLAPQALEIAARTLDGGEREILSWWNDGYLLEDESAGLGRGRFTPLRLPVPACAFDPRQELKERLAFLRRRGLDGVHYFRGKICFGLYSAGLIDRIRAKLGRVCPPISPDYTSMTAALNEARSAVDVGRSLQLSFISRVSNGAATASSLAHARAFHASADPDGEIRRLMPIPEAFMSVHNTVAADYLSVSQAWGGAEVDIGRLAALARADLDAVDWQGETAERQRQYAAVERVLATVRPWQRWRRDAAEAAATAARKFRPVAGRLLRAAGRRGAMPTAATGAYSSILDAADALGSLAACQPVQA